MLQGNPSIENYNKSKELFNSDEKSRIVSVIAESKTGNLLNL